MTLRRAAATLTDEEARSSDRRANLRRAESRAISHEYWPGASVARPAEQRARGVAGRRVSSRVRAENLAAHPVARAPVFDARVVRGPEHERRVAKGGETIHRTTLRFLVGLGFVVGVAKSAKSVV